MDKNEFLNAEFNDIITLQFIKEFSDKTGAKFNVVSGGKDWMSLGFDPRMGICPSPQFYITKTGIDVYYYENEFRGFPASYFMAKFDETMQALYGDAYKEASCDERGLEG